MTICFNLKMNPSTLCDFKDLLELYEKELATNDNSKCYATLNKLIIFAPFIYLIQGLKMTKGFNRIVIGAQDGFYKESGPYTAQVSIKMLQNIGIRNILVGHSERRKYFCENIESIALKIKESISLGIETFYLFGEKDKNEDYRKLIENEFGLVLTGIQNKDFKYLHFVYEPWWAIGGDSSATIDYIEKASNFIRNLLINKFKIDDSKIYYGGSINSNNMKELYTIKNINGVLIGSASLKKEEVRSIFEITKSINSN